MNPTSSTLTMQNMVILITGTPCVGKTTVAKELAKRLNGTYLNLTDLALSHNLTVGEDTERGTTIIDETKMRAKLSEIIDAQHPISVVIDGHYAASVSPREKVTNVFVLRRNPIQLREFMEKSGFKDQKLWENLASEILDVCLTEALREQDAGKVCELDVTDKSTEDVLKDIFEVLGKQKECRLTGVDWIGLLEREGKLDQYLKI